MRLYLHLTPNREIVPFNYQESLVGAFHRWLGPNELHDDMSLYSLSRLSSGQCRGKGLDFSNGSTFYISSPNPDLLGDMIQGVFKGHEIRWGMEVSEVTIQRTPDFGRQQRFLVQSPVLIKRRPKGERHHQYYFRKDTEANELMTDTLRQKMAKFGIEGEVQVRFDSDYQKPRIKMTRYRGIDIKGTLCPVIVEGDPRAVAFAWEAGVGNSTGIGFGALR